MAENRIGETGAAIYCPLDNFNTPAFLRDIIDEIVDAISEKVTMITTRSLQGGTCN